MVFEWLASALSSVFSWFVSWAPAPPVPSFFDDAAAATSQLGDLFAELSPWFPVGLVALILAAWAVALAAGIAIKLGRILLSFITLGGGSAA